MGLLHRRGEVSPTRVAILGWRRLRAAATPRPALVLALLVAVLSTGFAITPAHGEDSREDSRQVLRVGTSGDYPPFTQKLPQSSEPVPAARQHEGFDIDVARAFADAHDLRLEIVSFAWPSLLEDLAANRFDIAMSGVTVRPDRSIAGRFTVPVAESGAVVLVGPTKSFRDRETLDSPGVRLVVNAGGHLERVARRIFKYATIFALPDNDAVHMAFLDRSFDGVVTDTVEAQRWDPEQTWRRIGPLTHDRKAYLIRPEASRLAGQMDSFLIAAEADGTLPYLRSHWFGSHVESRPAAPTSALLAAIDERLALMSDVAAAKAAAGRAIEDPAREIVVLQAAVESTRKAAAQAGKPMPEEAAVRELFAALIEAAKEVQRNTPVENQSEAPPDLATELRPALIAIGERVARLVVSLDRPISTQQAIDWIDEQIHSCRLSSAIRRRLAQALSGFSRKR